MGNQPMQCNGYQPASEKQMSQKRIRCFSNELSNDNTFNTSGALAHSDQNHTGGLRMSGGDHDDQS